MIEDGGIVVLGGLISDQNIRGESRVPFLGRIPIIGLAFKTRNSDRNKSNLMIFIRPKILRDGVQAAYETDAKYNAIRDEQGRLGGREILPLLPGPKPKLPPAPPLPNSTPDAVEIDPRVLQEQERAKQRAEEDARKKAGPQGAPAPQASPEPSPPPESPQTPPPN
jgi:general secretion pathway protein D